MKTRVPAPSFWGAGLWFAMVDVKLRLIDSFEFPLWQNNITMENHHVYIMGKSTNSMAMFNT